MLAVDEDFGVRFERRLPDERESDVTHVTRVTTVTPVTPVATVTDERAMRVGSRLHRCPPSAKSSFSDPVRHGSLTAKAEKRLQCPALSHLPTYHAIPVAKVDPLARPVRHLYKLERIVKGGGDVFPCRIEKIEPQVGKGALVMVGADEPGAIHHVRHARLVQRRRVLRDRVGAEEDGGRQAFGDGDGREHSIVDCHQATLRREGGREEEEGGKGMRMRRRWEGREGARAAPRECIR